MNKPFLIIILLALLGYVTAFSWAQTEKDVDTHTSSAGLTWPELTGIDGKPVDIDKDKLQHLIIFDIWYEYSGSIDSHINFVSRLPDSFKQQSQQIWLQPEFNVTKAQLDEFVSHYPMTKPLVLDRQYTLMRQLGVWQQGLHLVIDNGQVLFKGEQAQLETWLQQRYPEQKLVGIALSSNVNKTDVMTSNEPKQLNELDFTLLTGQTFNLTEQWQTLSKDKTIKLVFIDSLCPMPQFPDCENQLDKLNQMVATQPTQAWLAVVNSYYVDEKHAKAFAEKYQLTLPLAFDYQNQLFKHFDVFATPYQIELDSQGKIVSRGDRLH
ncbi:redoxin domain-containing protein [Catenovulum sp. SM1970]|uniref:peroxiredoxin family protein n=1 Tax=Marinifaba aquimaris TaxID=2741323 RepID=UPI00157329DB|nr:redoxin domain-containing protein [Marinifaba aquimaris]NTS78631.1 redoxin domain-containing protein [Marinifaba aquimaris]